MPKPGRNDPCSCGSGRKFKYCCLPFPKGDANDPFEFIPDESIGSGLEGPAAKMMKEFLAERGSENFDSMEQLQAELDAFKDRGNTAPLDDFEGLSPDQMNAVLYAPLNSPGLIRFAEHVQAGPDVPILMILDELRTEIETGKPVLCTSKRNLPPKLVGLLYNKFRKMPVFDGLFEPVRIRGEQDVPVVYVTRNMLEVSGHLRTYAGKFILSRACRTQFKRGGYSAIYPEIFRSYVDEFNWSFWPTFDDFDPFRPFFCFTLFQLAKRGHEFVASSEYASAFYKAFPLVIDDLIGDDLSRDALEYAMSMYIITVVVHFWGTFGLIEYSDFDPSSDDFMKIRATPLFYELVQFPQMWLSQK